MIAIYRLKIKREKLMKETNCFFNPLYYSLIKLKFYNVLYFSQDNMKHCKMIMHKMIECVTD